MSKISMPSIRKTAGKPKRKESPDEQAFKQARNRMNKKRNRRDLSMHWAHFWNVCPKCGGDMFEQKAKSIFFEVCRKCHGIYIDKAELELAIKFHDSTKFAKSLLNRAKKPIIKV